MKKVMMVLSLCLAFVLASCANPNNSTNTDTTNVGTTFLNKNDISTLPDSFKTATWISITQVINNQEGVFFIKVADSTITDYGTMKGKAPVPSTLKYSDFLNAKSSNLNALKSTYPYWCEIDKDFYNANKEKLPNFLAN